MNDLISVIVPVYNVEQYLDRCICSIVNQIYTNLEIILVDDGSPDNCPTMCDNWAEKDCRIKVIHKENGGLSDARNAGLSVACGEYIAFIDSDDWLSSNYISVLYKAIIENEADISVCNYVITTTYNVEYSDDKFEVQLFNNYEAMRYQSESNLFKAVVTNKLYKKSLLENELFKVSKFHEDEFFTYKILSKAEKVVYTEKNLYFYFQRNGSIVNSYSIKHCDALEAFVERIHFLENNYPDLALSEKKTFSISCVNHYCEAISHNCPEAFKIIKNFRKQVKINFREFLKTPFKNQIYIIFSSININIFSRLIHYLRNK